MRFFTLMMLFLLAFYACVREDDEIDLQLRFAINTAENSRGLSSFILPNSNSLQAIPQDPKNPLTRNKIELGKLLFHESAFSTIGNFEDYARTYSCATCHHAGAGFMSGNVQGIGDGGIGFGVSGEGRKPAFTAELSRIDVAPLRTPSTLNVAYQTNLLWNGQFGATNLNIGTEDVWPAEGPVAMNRLGYEGVETQAIAGIKVHRIHFDETSIEMAGYKEAFDRAFPDMPDEKKYSDEGAGLAIAAYERTMLTYQAPFQLWLRGDDNAMTDRQKQGALLFFTKANCTHCHYGPNLASMEFHALGMEDLDENEAYNINGNDPAYLGRSSFTGKDEDAYKFKVPQLYNLKSSPFYGHGSTFRSIRAVISYKNEAVPQKSGISNLSDAFVPLRLSDVEIDLLAEFIEDGLYDGNLARFVPGSVFSGSCIPNNDYLSREDLGCR